MTAGRALPAGEAAPDPDRSIARQLECESVGEWYRLIDGGVPVMAAGKMQQWMHRSGKPFREVLLDFLERGALIMVREQDQAGARAALLAAGRKLPPGLARISE